MNRWRQWARVGMVLAVLAVPGLARGFTLIGPTAPTFAPVAGAGLLPVGFAGVAATQTMVNLATDPLGQPVQIKEFYRWQYPVLTYAFDPTFVQYFGRTGMAAMSNAFRVLNDYFEPENMSYTNGVSSMDLIAEYHNHFSTWRFNPSANINNVTDIETLTLGLLVNHLGLGNPHKGAFIIQDIIGLGFNAGNTAAVGNFQVAIRNYDPYTYEPSTRINGVDYSFFIASAPTPNIAAGVRPTIFDAVEYAVSSDDEYSAAAGIRDVINFGGLPWPIDAPTVFRTAGVFFSEDHTNAAPSRHGALLRDQPRHALTYDDAGGLKYIYRTNNLAVETLQGVTVVEFANMNPATTSQIRPNPFAPPEVPSRRTLAGLAMSGVIPSAPAGGILRPTVTQLVGTALRGGINKIRFDYTAYDSLLGQTYDPKSYEWWDVFLLDSMPTDQPQAQPPYFRQRVARSITAPDIIFTAQDIPVVGVTLPVITLPDDASWITYAGLNTRIAPLPQNSLGPGAIYGDNPITYTFSKRAPFYNVLYGGEQSLPGNLVPQFAWGWVTNTGPTNYLTFPEKSSFPSVEGTVAPSTTVPVITAMAKVPPAITSVITIDRCTEDLYLYGRRFDTASRVEVVDGAGTVAFTLPAEDLIVSDQVIKLPAGSFGFAAAGAPRFIRVVNSVGASAPSTALTINHGTPVIHSTDYDGLPWNLGKAMRIQGIGFTNPVAASSVQEIHFFPAQTNTAIAVLELNGNVQLTDTQIIIPAGYLKDATAAGLWSTGSLNSARSDHDNVLLAANGFTRRIRLSGNGGANMSPFRPTPSNFGINHDFSHIGAGGDYNGGGVTVANVVPRITGVTTTSNTNDGNADGRQLDRDDPAETLTITGFGLDLALTIEFVDGTGKLIQVINPVNSLPPFPVSLRSAAEPSALGTGVTITPAIIPANEQTTITIDAVTFGLPLLNLYDSASGNNADTNRLVVIRTPFGTAIQDATLGGSPALWITP